MTTADFIATNRFGLGARPDELGVIGGDPRGWLAMQVNGTRKVPDGVRALPSSVEIFESLAEEREERREARAEPRSGTAAAERLFTKIRQTLAPIYLEQVATRYRIAAGTVEPFRERLVHFWTNHFAVSADKPQVTALAATLENEVIRPRIASSFADMLLAAESHPAMILYLDNQASIGPNSTFALRAGKPHAHLRAKARHQREPRPRDPRTPYDRRKWRLHPGRRHGSCTCAHRLVHRRESRLPPRRDSREFRVSRIRT